MTRRPDLPRPPADYRPATAMERRRTTPATMAHNRRLGWMIHVAQRHGLVPTPGASLDARVALVLLLLPDDFTSPDQAALYVAQDDDRDLALSVLDDPRQVTVQLPSGQALDLVATTDDDRLAALQLLVLT